MDLDTFNRALFEFLDASPTPFHAVNSQIELLEKAGFKRLYEADAWDLKPGNSYYVTRNDSSLIAFNSAMQPLLKTGIRMLGAHTDSPCLKVKPNPEIIDQSCLKLGVEVYGGALLNPWFDRDLSLAGRVVYREKTPQAHADRSAAKSSTIKSRLIDFQRAIAVIPSLAIHLDREANKNRSINPQTDILPVLMMLEQHDSVSLAALLKEQMLKQDDTRNIDEIIDYELVFYDTCKAAAIGVHQDFIASSRLDNLLSCFIATRAIIAMAEQTHSGPQEIQACSLIVCNDHEEAGSVSASGAQGNFLKSVLQRLTRSSEELSRVIDQSLLISADNAHGIHPNYADKHDARHGPILNQGPVIKVNANQRYASNAQTMAMFKILAQQLDIPVQSFVVRSDMGCGSTIGPVTASEIGIKTVDIGIPTFAMHSIRELCGNKDSFYLYEIVKLFFDFKQSLQVSSL